MQLRTVLTLASFVTTAVTIALLATLGVLATSTTAVADMNFNSSEPGCDGSDPNVLMCDDFESGAWYSLNCDIANTTGGLLQTHGWCGTIYADPITPAGAAVCGSKGAVGTNCAAHGGQHTGGAGGVSAQGSLKTACVTQVEPPSSEYERNT